MARLAGHVRSTFLVFHYHGSGYFADHNGGGVGIASDQIWYDRGIGCPQPFDAVPA